MNKIFSGTDRAVELGLTSFRDLLNTLAEKAGVKVVNGLAKKSVLARVDFGRWIADCECGGAGYVDPSDPVFLCTACGNLSSGGKFRPVIFPPDRQGIEVELLKRNVIARSPSPHPTQVALTSTPSIPGLTRSWTPGESLTDLIAEREALENTHDQL